MLGAPTSESGVIEEASRASESRWTILLSKVDTSRPELLKQVLDSLRPRFPEIYLAKREGKSFLAYGHYTDPRSSKARADLKRIHNYTVTLGEKTINAYASAFMAPPSADSLQGNNPAYDLRNVRDRFGKSAMYTLQIGLYGYNDRTAPTSKELTSFRRAAEQAVSALRREGEQAFYYHSPGRSTVTVGVFFYREDHDPDTFPPFESARLKAARKLHPLNLLNGQGITEIVRDERGQKVRRLQPSALVGIPKK